MSPDDSPPAPAKPPEPTPAGGEKRNPFAVPETVEERQRHFRSAVVVPESTEEDEEVLIQTPRRGPRAIAPFSADKFEPWFVVLLFVLSTLAVLSTTSGVGMCWDEAYYVKAGRDVLDWMSEAAGAGKLPVRGPKLATYWQDPPGHPSVTRFLVAAGLVLHGEAGASPLFAMRRPIAVCYGLTLVVLYLLTRRTYGRVTAWLTVMAYFFMPRVFGHAHFAVTETPMTLMTVVVVYAFLRGLESRWWALGTGLFFGLAMATKINAILLLPILLPWAFLFCRRRSVNNLYAMLLISPLVLCAAWPWLWDKPVQHFIDYLKWNFDHGQAGVYYFGTLYNLAAGNAPWHYSFVMTALTLPVVTLGLAIIGVARTFRAPRKHNAGLLFLWAALLPCLALAGSAQYDGVRLFLPAFPFIAILAGIGGSVLVRIAAFFDRRGERLSKGQAALLVLLALVIFNGGYGLATSRPYYLSYFNLLTAGRSGAYAKGIDVAYWGEALNKSAIDQINEKVPDGSTLMPLALNNQTLKYYQQWGLLKKEIRLVEGRGPADYHLLQYRRGMFARPEWTLYDDYQHQKTLEIGPHDAPMIGLYKTGPEFELRWPKKELP